MFSDILFSSSMFIISMFYNLFDQNKQITSIKEQVRENE